MNGEKTLFNSHYSVLSCNCETKYVQKSWWFVKTVFIYRTSRYRIMCCWLISIKIKTITYYKKHFLCYNTQTSLTYVQMFTHMPNTSHTHTHIHVSHWIWQNKMSMFLLWWLQNKAAEAFRWIRRISPLVTMTKTVPVLMTTASLCNRLCPWLDFLLLLFFFSLLPRKKKKTHVGTASRLWSLIRKDENTHLWSARVNCEEKERKKMIWKPAMAPTRMAGLQKGTPTQNPHILYKEAFHTMHEWHAQRADRYGNNTGLHFFCKNLNIVAHFRKYAYSLSRLDSHACRAQQRGLPGSSKIPCWVNKSSKKKKE